MEGAPENRAGKSTVAAHLLVCVWALGTRALGTKVLCSPTDPFDQGVVASDEVKEEPPEPFQKIGPSMGSLPGTGREGGLGEREEDTGGGGQGNPTAHLAAVRMPPQTSLCPLV